MMYTDRILNGNITSFVPVLCSDAINTDLAKSYVTPSSINRCVSQVEQIDYSIFYRDHRVSFEEFPVEKMPYRDGFPVEQCTVSIFNQ